MGTSDQELVIDLTSMPSGERYEDRYGAYLDVFKRIAEFPGKAIVVSPPASWLPLTMYLGAWLKGQPQEYFEHCHLVRACCEEGLFSRTAVEVLCGFRPECVDALYKVDNQWEIPEGRRQQMQPAVAGYQKEFIVTCNGSFFRPEVMHYLKEVLPKYQPTKKKVVLVPCAADKPYPAKLHKEVLFRMPDDYYLCIHTGVLGLVPQDLWDEMPQYDSGLPYEWRLMNTVREYFSQHRHEHVIVFADFYSLALQYGLMWAGYEIHTNSDFKTKMSGVATFVNEVKSYDDYLNLLDTRRLDKLERAFRREEIRV